MKPCLRARTKALVYKNEWKMSFLLFLLLSKNVEASFQKGKKLIKCQQEQPFEHQRKDFRTWADLLCRHPFHFIVHLYLGCGGGTNGRAMAFCQGSPVWILGWTFGFFQFRIAVNLFSVGVRLFQITCNIAVHTLPSSFLLPITIYQLKIFK